MTLDPRSAHILFHGRGALCGSGLDRDLGPWAGCVRSPRTPPRLPSRGPCSALGRKTTLMQARRRGTCNSLCRGTRRNTSTMSTGGVVAAKTKHRCTAALRSTLRSWPSDSGKTLEARSLSLRTRDKPKLEHPSFKEHRQPTPSSRQATPSMNCALTYKGGWRRPRTPVRWRT